MIGGGSEPDGLKLLFEIRVRVRVRVWVRFRGTVRVKITVWVRVQINSFPKFVTSSTKVRILSTFREERWRFRDATTRVAVVCRFVLPTTVGVRVSGRG